MIAICKDAIKRTTMLHITDLYLGAFLIICGFFLSIFNLRTLVTRRNVSSSVLISENLIIMCTGIAFLIRAFYELDAMNVDSSQIEDRSYSMIPRKYKMPCDFRMLLMAYGPFIISLVNSFLSLVIDNYMHYKSIVGIKKETEEDSIQVIDDGVVTSSERNIKTSNIFWKKYFMSILIVIQWIVPVLLALSMYPIEVKTKSLLIHDFRDISETCMTMVDLANDNCTTYVDTENSFDTFKSIPLINFINVTESLPVNNSVSFEIDNVINNVLNIIGALKNESKYLNPNITTPMFRTPKSDNECMKICYLENKNLVLYMFLLCVISYFVPITISIVILTKMHVDMKKSKLKTHVSKELLYNILFWSPVMFETLISLLLCSYTMNGMRTTIFNVIANVYQTIKNFMNTKYYKENSVVPV